MKAQIALSECQQFADRDAMLRITSEIDEDWYEERYPDVARLNISARDHFIRFGEAMRRSPGPDFDTDFYLDTYRLWHPSQSPLADFLTAKELYDRPTTPAQMQRDWDALKSKAELTWGPEGPRKISYCTPLMNRFDDIHTTLEWNLEANRAYEKEIEFLIIEFGPSSEVSDWIHGNPKFKRDLESGYLRVISDRDTLDTWHFGRAKNAFKAHMKGQIYSSLDGDNFVTGAETEWLLAVAEDHQFGFVTAHSTGDFSDGTCGRISMPARLYRSTGYHERFLPRQWDELDCMVGALRLWPVAPLVVPPPPNMESMTSFIDFIEHERMPNRIVQTAYPERRLPENPQGHNFLRQNPTLIYSARFNAGMSGIEWTVSRERRKSYRKAAIVAGYCFSREMPADTLLQTMFRDPPELPALTENDLPLFACMKDDERFLPAFLQHYRKLGITHFFVIDDGSATPIASLDLGPDVYVLRTKSGSFETAKALWIHTVIKSVIREGAWFLTVDADEFLQLPARFKTLREVITALTQSGQDFCPGLMLDLLPSNPAKEVKDPDRLLEAFDSFCWRTDEPATEYKNQGTVRWGFGDRSEVSWRVDIRYHAFGTVDSMRKIPLVRWKEDRFLNEGFHSLHAIDGREHKSVDPSIVDRDIILPIFHYKLVKLWEEDTRREMLQKSLDYDVPTAQNIKKIFDGGDQKKMLSRLKSWLIPAAEARNLDFRSSQRAKPSDEDTPHKVPAQDAEGPILILALQRTGSTTFAFRLFEQSHFSAAADHEPFLAERTYGHLLRDFKNLLANDELEAGLSDVLKNQECIKHCFDVIPFPFTKALVAAAMKANYRFVFLYRSNLLNRLASAAFARAFKIWGPEHARNVSQEELESAGSVRTGELLRKEADIINFMNTLWADLKTNGANAVSVSFEELFEADEDTAVTAIDRLFDGLSLGGDGDFRRKFVENLRSRGEQGTKSQYAKMPGYDQLVEGVAALPKIELG